MSGHTAWTRTKILTEPPRSADPHEPSATDRQERIPGFDQARFSALSVLLVGAGGLNGEVAEGLLRKGVGSLKIFDPDRVELSNLNRQRFFAKDLGENKAIALARNLKPEATGRTWLIAQPVTLQDAVNGAADTRCDVAVCGVDNNRTRAYASQFFRLHGVAVIILGVSRDGAHGYVFVQETNVTTAGKAGTSMQAAACFGCAFPDAVENLRDPCPNTPAIKDILKVVAGVALYAVDSLFMSRPRFWNYRQIFLDGSMPDRSVRVERREGCLLCHAAGGRRP